MDAIRAHHGTGTRIDIFAREGHVAAGLYPEINFHQCVFDLTRWQPASEPRTLLQRASNRIRRSLRVQTHVRSLLLLAKIIGMMRLELPIGRSGRGLSLLNCYATSDLIISTGGTYIIPEYGLEPIELEYRIIKAFGKPWIFYTQSIGDFKGTSSEQLVREIFTYASVIVVRDDTSIENLLRLGIPKNKILIRADAAFSFAAPNKFRDRRSANQISRPDRRTNVAISVREWDHFKGVSQEQGMSRYVRTIRSLVIALVRDHYATVTFMSTCQGIQEYRDDAELSARIVAQLPADVQNAVTLTTAFLHPRDITTRLEKFDFSICTRMHMAILSLCAGVPVIPISYGFKTTDLFRRLGLGHYTIDINDTDRSDSVRLLERFVGNYENICENLIEPLKTLKDEAIGTYRDICHRHHSAGGSTH